MTIKGNVSVKPVVVEPAAITITLDDAGEIRRLGRLLLAGRKSYNTGKTGSFANDLISQLGFNEANTAKK